MLLPTALPVEDMVEVGRGEEAIEEEVELGREGGLEDAEETDGEVEDDEVEEDYTLQFEGDPLGFVQEGDHEGTELYQHFERLEYEALAERKRKALQQCSRNGQAKKPKKDELLGVSMEEIEEMMNFGFRRRASSAKKRGRKKGSRNKLSPEVNIKIGDATLHYASGNYSEAIPILEEVVQLAPNLPDSYFILGLIYDAMNDRKKALNFHMIAAHLSPKDVTLWKKLVAWSIEQKNFGQVRYCLSKAIAADPKDIGLRFNRALLYFELGEYQKAADSCNQIVSLYPANVEARKMASKMYQKCGQLEKAIGVLEDYVNDYPFEDDISIFDQLISLNMENSSYDKAVQLIEKAKSAFGPDKELPLCLKARNAICHAHLGNMEIAKDFLQDLRIGNFEDHYDLVNEVANTFQTLGQYHYALNLYFILSRTFDNEKATLNLNIGQCYASLSERGKAIPFYYKALSKLEDDIDARITLSFLLIDEGKDDEAISLLSPLKCSSTISDVSSTFSKPWWLSEKVKMQLAKIYHSKGRLEEFVDVIFPSVQKTLLVESMNQKLKARSNKRLSKSVLLERVKLLDDQQEDNVFRGFKPVATSSDLLKANRAKKSLEKQAALGDEKNVAAPSAGMDWQCDDSNEDATKEIQDLPLPGLLKDEENQQLLLDLCKTMVSLHRYSEALEIINLLIRLPNDRVSSEKKEELQSLGAQIAYITPDPKHAFDYARNMVKKHPYSISAWNSYYEVILRFQNRFGKHLKFLHQMRVRHRDCLPPMIINGNQCTMQSMHQAAAEEYLQAYKHQPENPLINLCVGTALINLALGFRLQNKHQCVVQGFAFLYNYLSICNNKQEALYNIARAYQHVGLVTLAVLYYEKVLAIQQKDFPISKPPNQDPGAPASHKPGYCNLHMEAAFNLHLIYKKSGAIDLSRKILKSYCTP
ncbi:general transcription factor 3C polypeptide 3 [Dendrobium catenatum]|uniref:general transcription factor 3C polypeptide 3 n=1 Tax=Dendrobium catenatum TaxID=906689 RepID=UPI00109F10F6|nr:general transcription factor 3C polypeptide 3 [Dendrobium catenatum]XP_028557055.1 general transcription factor 3C polypeptide 3 [Dendrobium catenatum]